MVIPQGDRSRHIERTVKITPALLTAMLYVACVVTGCQSPKARPAPGNIATQSTRNNCYSLLHDLLEDQKNVSLLLFIKREQNDVNTLIKAIAENSATAAKLLEEFAKHDPSISLDDMRLPSGEVATREAIAATKKKDLLDESGDTFELSLLLTQLQALSYGWHLAKIASENETQPDRARTLAGIREDMKHLYRETFALLLSRTK